VRTNIAESHASSVSLVQCPHFLPNLRPPFSISDLACLALQVPMDLKVLSSIARHNLGGARDL
jgi:hypothetical protein